ncbi:MAG: hypothetical protein WAK55_07110 [Xanthobacteraceae bacterium]
MKKHLLATASIAVTLSALGVDRLPAQIPNRLSSVVSGSGSTTTSTAFNIISFGAGWNTSYRLYITGVQCGRTDTGTGSLKITFNDAATTVIVLPGTSGGAQQNVHFGTPLQVAADTNFTGTTSANTTTVYCSAQGLVNN